MSHLLYNIRTNRDFRAHWFALFGILLVVKLLAGLGYMALWPVYTEFEHDPSQHPLWLEISWRFLCGVFFVDWLSLVPLDKFCILVFRTNVFQILGGLGFLFIVLVWAPLITLGQALIFVYLREHGKDRVRRWRGKVDELKESLAPKTWEYRLCLAVWLTPVLAFVAHLLWSKFVNPLDAAHSLVNPSWWPWKNWSALDACFVPAILCSVMGTNGVFIGMIRRRPALIIAGIASLIVAVIVYLRVCFAYY